MENNILQIIPLVSQGHTFGEYRGSIIALALIEEQGKQRLAYILHDMHSGQPVLQNVTLTQHLEEDRI